MRAAVLGGAALLAACGTSQPDPAAMAPVSGFAGFAIADEPQAARVGERILSRNGNAADAAVAMALSMSVTLPSRAGLGGGGICLISNTETRSADVIEFLPQSLPSGAVVPATARGLTLLHARHGSLMWPLLVTPAEQQARFGFNMSRALMADVQAAGGRLNPQVSQALFDRSSLAGIEVGDSLTQPQLSTLLAGLRQRGANSLYAGEVAQRFVAGSEQIGRAVTMAELRDYRPLEPAVRSVDYGDHRIFVPATRASEVVLAGLEGASAPSGATANAGAAGAGLVVGDRFGRLVACNLSMGETFGSAQVVPGTGLLMASPADTGADSLSPAVLRNRHTARNIGAASVSGEDAAQALVQAIRALGERGGNPRAVLETTRSQPASGRINLLVCPAGLAEGPAGCLAVNDPGGYGLAVRAQ